MNVWFDVDTHKDLGRIKLEHDIDMREIAYIAIRKFLDEYMKDGKLNEKGIKLSGKETERIEWILIIRDRTTTHSTRIII